MNRLRPLALGELLDRSVTFWRGNWKPLFRLTIGFQLVQLIAMKLMQVGIKRFFPLVNSTEVMSLARSAPEQILPQAAGAMALMIAVTLVLLLVSEIAGVATSHFGWPRLIGTGAPSAGDAFRHAAARLGPTIGAFALSIGWSLVVMVLMLLPAFALAGAAIWFTSADAAAPAALFAVLAALALLAGVVVLVLWFIIRCVLLGQILAIEDVGAWTAFRRADTMSSGRVVTGVMGLVKLRLTVLITVMGGVLLLMSTVASVPSLIAAGAYGASFGPGRGIDDVVPALLLIPLEIIQTALASIVAPLYVIFQLYFYADMRVRREGLDLELELGATTK